MSLELPTPPADAYGFVVLNRHSEPTFFTARDYALAEKTFLEDGSALIPVYRRGGLAQAEQDRRHESISKLNHHRAGIIERCMDMLADVPGNTLEDRLTHYIGSYMALQIQSQGPPIPSTDRGSET